MYMLRYVQNEHVQLLHSVKHNGQNKVYEIWTNRIVLLPLLRNIDSGLNINTLLIRYVEYEKKY